MRLTCANANELWPVKDAWAHIVFGSRVFHLLNTSQVAKEVARVAHPSGAIFLIGRVKRSKNSVKSQMRTRMRQLLVEQGLTPLKSKRKRNELLARVGQRGAPLVPIQAASWKKTERPIDSITGWASKDTMGGITPPPAARRAILDDLRNWATAHFGNPAAEIDAQEHYILEGMRLATR